MDIYCEWIIRPLWSCCCSLLAASWEERTSWSNTAAARSICVSGYCTLYSCRCKSINRTHCRGSPSYTQSPLDALPWSSFVHTVASGGMGVWVTCCMLLPSPRHLHHVMTSLWRSWTLSIREGATVTYMRDGGQSLIVKKFITTRRRQGFVHVYNVILLQFVCVFFILSHKQTFAQVDPLSPPPPCFTNWVSTL